MSRQPAQRSIFEGLRRQAETTRTTQIAANDRLAQRNAAARFAAAQAQRDADTATAAANAATGEAANATAAVAEATAQIDAANAGASAATAAVATANAAMTHLARSTVIPKFTVGDERAPSAWSNLLGLKIEGYGEGLLSIVRIAIPVAGQGSVTTNRQEFQLRLNGSAVCERTMSTQQQQLMTFTYARTTPLPAGLSTYELWWRGGSDAIIDDGDGDSALRAMTVFLVAG